MNGEGEAYEQPNIKSVILSKINKISYYLSVNVHVYLTFDFYCQALHNIVL